MRVMFYATLRQIVGKKSVTLNLAAGSTISDLLTQCIELYPGLINELLDQNDELYGHIRIFVNKQDHSYQQGLKDLIIRESDEIHIFPAIGGGSS